MKALLTPFLTVAFVLGTIVAQTPQNPQPTPPEIQSQDVVRISTSLVQTDVVVTDNKNQIISDLTTNDFKVFENGKKQEVRFLEFVSGDSSPRTEGELSIAGRPVEPDVARNLSSSELRRVFAFVVDDLTLPVEDVEPVRKMLTNFVDNQMREGDLVAIVRVIGGGGILQQFTSDKRILQRAILQIKVQPHAYSAFNSNMAPAEQLRTDLLQAAADEGAQFPEPGISSAHSNLDATEDGTTRGLRALATLVTAGEVINSMKTLPGRKNMVLLSGGLPFAEAGPTQVLLGGAPVTVVESRYYLSNVTTLMRQLSDRASRAGVVINTMDIRGLGAHRGVSRFTDPGNEGTSALFGGSSGGRGFGRGVNPGTFDNLSLDTMSGHQGLQLLAENTGGVSVINTDNFAEGLERVMARSSYYLLAYQPTESFDGRYHKIEIKVNRPGAKVYTRQGYYAVPDAPSTARTKEQKIVQAAMSPLARREVNLSGILQYRFTPDNQADIDINLAIDAKTLSFAQDESGKSRVTFDVVGFVVNNLGKANDGFSQTVNATFSPNEYQRALTNGISFTGHAVLPPGTYQFRAVVRDAQSGRLGTIAQYLEIPDLTKKRLTSSSLFLYAVDLAQGNKAPAEPLNAMRQLPRKLDLRYAAVIYNPKLEDGKPQLKSQLIISRNGKIVFQEQEQPVPGPIQNGQMAKIGQLSLAKASPGRYVLTLLITDPLADKKARTLVRSTAFNLVE
jgi:VWFA-related protein